MMKWAASVLMCACAALSASAAPAVSIDNAALQFLPPETRGIVFVDVAGLRNTPIVQEALDRRGFSPDGRFSQFVGLTGIDPQQDVDSVTIAKLADGRSFAVLQGRIDAFKVDQVMKQNRKESEAYLGRTFYRDGKRALALVENVAIVGQFEAVQKAIEQSQLPGSLPLRSELTAAMAAIDPGNQIWGVGDFTARDLRSAGIRAPAPLPEILKQLQNGAYQVRVDSGVHARVIGRFADAQSAKDLGDMARSAIAIAKVKAAQQRPDAVSLLNGIEIRSNGTTLTVDMNAPGDVLRYWK